MFPDNFVKLLPPDFDKEGNVSLHGFDFGTPATQSQLWLPRWVGLGMSMEQIAGNAA